MVNYNRVTNKIIDELRSIVGAKNVLVDECDLICYARDHSLIKSSEWFARKPDVVVIPASTKEVFDIICLANREKIPVTPRGGGTGCAGNALPSYGGILIDTKRMNKIIEIDEDNMLVTAQAGITLEQLDRELRKHGFTFPDDPTSYRSAVLGGRISTFGAGWSHSQYGSIMDLVVGFEVVLACEKIIRFGGGGSYEISKSSVGYPLKYLFFGANGTLGVITEVTAKIYPLPEAIICRSFAFNSLKEALKTALRLRKTGITFTTLTVCDKYRSLLVKKIDPTAPLYEAVLSYALSGLREVVDVLDEKVIKICRDMGGQDLGTEVGKLEYEQRFDFDSAVPGMFHLISKTAIWVDEEPGILTTTSMELYERILNVFKKYGISEDLIYGGFWWSFTLPTFTILWGVNEKEWKDEYVLVSEEIAKMVLKVGGTISSVHGIGPTRLYNFVPKELGSSFEIMKKVKKIFDPNNIMNPGKLGLDEAYTHDGGE